MNNRPLQNRVDPSGKLHAVFARGTLMGNRGILHDDEQRIRRPWQHQAWICCQLSFKDRKRALFSPGSYSELFFLDEATAFAAGHRPCGECRRERYQLFKAWWTQAHQPGSSVTSAQVDKVLHAERTLRGGGKRTYQATLSELPPGTFFEHGGIPYLVWHHGYRPWSFDGYGRAVDWPSDTQVRELTPASIVTLFRLGFVPQVHPSAGD